jgi:hypothetical protein
MNRQSYQKTNAPMKVTSPKTQGVLVGSQKQPVAYKALTRKNDIMTFQIIPTFSRFHTTNLRVFTPFASCRPGLPCLFSNT